VPVDGIDADELESDVLVVVEWESKEKPGNKNRC
jgi:hypothetical protein